MVTLAAEIVRRYNELEKKTVEVVGQSVFPKLGHVDATDIAAIIVSTFSSSYPSNYKPIITTMAALRCIRVTQEQMNTIYPDAEEFIDWLICEMRTRNS